MTGPTTRCGTNPPGMAVSALESWNGLGPKTSEPLVSTEDQFHNPCRRRNLWNAEICEIMHIVTVPQKHRQWKATGLPEVAPAFSEGLLNMIKNQFWLSLETSRGDHLGGDLRRKDVIC